MKSRKKRKNRKILFDEDKYIEQYYYQDDKVVIPVLLEKISDLYMEHDYKQMELSDSVCDYIEEIAYMVPINIDIEIEIHCPKVDKETDTIDVSPAAVSGHKAPDSEEEQPQKKKGFLARLFGW